MVHSVGSDFTDIVRRGVINVTAALPIFQITMLSLSQSEGVDYAQSLALSHQFFLLITPP
jgi:hypothetical protein